MKAVLFDLDGTLTNTLDDIADAMNTALRQFHLPEHTVDAYRYLVGDGVVKLAQRAVGHRQDVALDVQKAYQAYYETHTAIKTRPYEGIPELLHALSAAGLKLCVFSNKPDADTRHVVQHFFPQIEFALVRGQLPGVPVKPDPTGALAVADALGLDPQDFLYLGDTSVDMLCARNAGMHPIGVLWGFREEQELREAGAEQIISHPREALSFAQL